MIKVIQHRVNDYLIPRLSDFAELDIHIDSDGEVVIKHDPDERLAVRVPAILSMGFDKLLIDIKQNLSPRFIRKIVDVVGFDNILGFIDVPWPSASFFLNGVKPNLYWRLSRYERPPEDASKIYIDPITEKCETRDYKRLIIDFSYYNRRNGGEATYIIAAPDLHGKDLNSTLQVVRDLHEDFANTYMIKSLEGIITKYPTEVQELVSTLNGK